MKIVLGIAGEIASGKGTIAKYLVVEKGANSHQFSTMLRDVLDRLYLEQSRDNMQRLSTMLRQTYGEDVMAKVMAEDARKDEGDIIVIDGVRRLDDIKYLKKLPEFKLVYVEASIEKRYERIVQRGENSDDTTKTFEEFKKDHERETELQIKDLKNFANIVVDNNGNLDELHKQLNNIVE